MSRQSGRLYRVLEYISVYTGILLLWTGLSLYIDRDYVPDPVRVFSRMVSGVLEGYLLRDLLATLYRVSVAVSIALATGLAAGVVASWARSRFSREAVRSLVILTYPIPHVTLLPILFFLFDIELSKILLIAIISFYPIAVSVMEWTERFPRDLGDLVYVMGGDRLDLLRYVVIPSSLPGILTGLRISVSTAYAVVFIAESMVGGTGIGYLIYWYWQRLDYVGMYSAILLLSIVGVSTYLILLYLEKRVLKWLY